MLILPFGYAMPYMVGYVNDFEDISANDMEVRIWIEGQGNITNNYISGIVGVNGLSNTDNIYMIDCEICQVDNIVLAQIYNDNYTSNIVNLTVSGAGYEIFNNLTLSNIYNNEPEVEPEIEPEVELEVEPEIEPEVEPEIEPIEDYNFIAFSLDIIENSYISFRQNYEVDFVTYIYSESYSRRGTCDSQRKLGNQIMDIGSPCEYELYSSINGLEVYLARDYIKRTTDMCYIVKYI